MRPDGVVELPVPVDVEAEVVAVVDLVAVEVLVFERAEGAFADAVLAWAVPLRADVDQLRVRVDEGGEARRLEARAIVRDECDRPRLAGFVVGDRVEWERPGFCVCMIRKGGSCPRRRFRTS